MYPLLSESKLSYAFNFKIKSSMNKHLRHILIFYKYSQIFNSNIQICIIYINEYSRQFLSLSLMHTCCNLFLFLVHIFIHNSEGKSNDLAIFQHYLQSNRTNMPIVQYSKKLKKILLIIIKMKNIQLQTKCTSEMLMYEYTLI